MYEYLDRRYADALYEVAEKRGKVEEYLRDLREIVDIIYNTEEILKILQHPDINTNRKKRAFIELFKGKVDEELLSFLLILIDKGRVLFIREKLDEMEKIYLDKKNTMIAYVKTAMALLESDKQALLNRLEARYNKKILFKEEIDKSIIGGVMLKVGSDVIDGTVRSRLYDIKESAMKSRWR